MRLSLLCGRLACRGCRVRAPWVPCACAVGKPRHMLRHAVTGAASCLGRCRGVGRSVPDDGDCAHMRGRPMPVRACSRPFASRAVRMAVVSLPNHRPSWYRKGWNDAAGSGLRQRVAGCARGLPVRGLPVTCHRAPFSSTECAAEQRGFASRSVNRVSGVVLRSHYEAAWASASALHHLEGHTTGRSRHLEGHTTWKSRHLR